MAGNIKLSSLPALREDLSLLDGPRDKSGHPTWNIYDAARHQYFRLGWLEFEMLSRWRIHSKESLVASIQKQTTLQIQPQKVDSLIEFLDGNDLLERNTVEAAQALTAKAGERARAGQKSLFKRLLFFRLPLLNPEPVLKEIYPWLKGLFHPIFWGGILMLLLLDLILLNDHWTYYRETFWAYLTVDSMVYYALAIAFCKILHEWGHALTAWHFGARVPQIGVAFMVLWPILYTDTTGAWAFKKRYQRLLVNAAGMITECMLAIIATFLWCLSTTGALKDAFFFISSVAWVMTLLVNLNPFLRFDGYYLLADLFDSPNLQPRSFKYTKWVIAESLFAFGHAPPEYVERGHRRWLVLYALLTWTYRLTVFLGIAWLIYQYLFKAVGLVLLCVTLVQLVVMPLLKEIIFYIKHIRETRVRMKNSFVWLCLLGGVMLLVLPWRPSVTSPAILAAIDEERLFVPHDATLLSQHVKSGQQVTEGQLLFELQSEALACDKKRLEQELAKIRQQIDIQARYSFELGASQASVADLAKLETELAGLRDTQSRLQVVAPFSGVVLDVNQDLSAGQSLAKDARLATLVKSEQAKLVAYVDESTAKRLVIGAKAVFKSAGKPIYPGRFQVVDIDQTQTTSLHYPALSDAYGGEIKTHRQGDIPLQPVQPVYRILLQAEKAHSLQRQVTGRVFFEFPPESFVTYWAKVIWANVVREIHI